MGFPIQIKIQNKHVNKKLIDSLVGLMESTLKKDSFIEGIFGKIILERGNLSFFPLCICEGKKPQFISLSEDIALEDHNSKIVKYIYNR